ncbi:sigma 54-interacting transcriptional regulator [Planctomycetota bacterium]
MRFQQEISNDISFLKSGIETRNKQFDQLIGRIEHVAGKSLDPILLMGPTGAGKSQLARRIFELKRNKHQLKGNFIEVNCATLRADAAMSVLFGHTKGAFTGAVQARKGLLLAAHQGILFLDEIGELGLDEQAMLLRAIEEKTFLPVGSDQEASSDFQLICGTNRDLQEAVKQGRFREDLLARIDLWTFYLPGLRDRLEDIEPKLLYELDRYAQKTGSRVTFNKEAWQRFLSFAKSPESRWTANFHDLISAITRMATLAPGRRITRALADEEIDRLKRSWGLGENTSGHLERYLDKQRYELLDRFERVQLEDVVSVCSQSRTLSDAGRILFAVSRKKKNNTNDADRLRKYLARYNLTWKEIQGGL